MLFALGLGDQVVAVTHECDFPSEAEGKPHLTSTVIPPGLTAAEIDAEVKRVTAEGRALYELDEARLAELDPELIVTQAVCEVCAVSSDDVLAVAERLPSPPRVISLDPSSLGEVLADVDRLAGAAAVPEAGGRLRAGLEARLAAIAERVAGEARRGVLALEWLDPPFLGGHWVPEMVAIAGGEALLSRPGEKSREVGWAQLRSLRPDLVVAMPCGSYVEDSCRQVRPHLETLREMGEPEIWAVDAASTFSRPGPRLVDGVELLAHLVHPEAAEPPPGIGFRRLEAPAPAAAG